MHLYLVTWFALLLGCIHATVADDFDALREGAGVKKEDHGYQSDVARMRKIVINSLYSHRDIFLRELLSNANDALEKLRLISLTEKGVLDPSLPMNITIKVVKEDTGGRIVITDTGIGMSPEELTLNLGTMAKSGTSEFISRAEQGADSSNLIGSFGLGFYSSFLVADHVYVASIPPKSSKHPDPQQHVFSSSAEDSSFQIYADPRGNTLGHGTEITLVLKDDALLLADTDRLQALVAKHSSFSTAYPIWLLTTVTEEVEISDESRASESMSEIQDEADSEEAIVEESEETSESAETPLTETVTVNKWIQLNSQPPLWMRDPKTVTDEEYIEFYKATFKEVEPPIAWQHFKGDSGTGVSFRALIFVPNSLPDEFWNSPKANSKDIRLLVKRVFITNDLGNDGVAKWASWLKVIVDADDLPLNVSRETLQSAKFLKQMKQIIVNRLLQLLAKLAQNEPDKFEAIMMTYGNAFKLGAVENVKEREKLAGLCRWHTNQRNFTSLDQYVENRREGQKQIFYHAAIGQKPEVIAKSVFVEKLIARGYEVFLLSDPLDEFLYTNLGHWKGLQFQNAAKKGLKFGDEESGEAAKEELSALEEEYEPLLKWLKSQVSDIVRDVTVSNRLVTSPCAIVADTFGYSANMEKLMNAQNTKKSSSFMHDLAKKQKYLEINPNSPLIQGLLRRVRDLPETDPEENDSESVQELREVTAILIDGALVRSGFEVADSNLFFTRIDHVLRRSLGVSESLEADSKVEPAPPVETKPLDPEDAKARVEVPEHLKGQLDIEMEEVPDDEDYWGNKIQEHDEL